MRANFAGLQPWPSASGAKPTQGTPGQSDRTWLWASTDPDMRCWGLGWIREGFSEEVKPGSILGRGRLGQRPRGGEGLLGRGVEWWEHGTVSQHVIHGLWIPKNITGYLGTSPLSPQHPRLLRSPELSWDPNQPQSQVFYSPTSVP